MFRFAVFACVSAGTLIAMGVVPTPKLEDLPDVSMPDISMPAQPVLAGFAGFSFGGSDVAPQADDGIARPKARPVMMASGAYQDMSASLPEEVAPLKAVGAPIAHEAASAGPTWMQPVSALVDKVSTLVQPVADTPPPIMPSTVNFDFDVSDLDDEAVSQLSAFAAQLRANPGVEIGIYGHTDLIGGEDYNDDLGLRRATSVASFLLASGVPEDVIRVVKSYGETRPVVDTEGKSRANRRVIAEVSLQS